ncbi:MAG TPA: molybdopterin-dependent oxidoreductase [Pyrinomonadaceae bacterium]|jgi:DMSO/TMAO reductase YedYZ molybdopterin-dependent catalytic subunit|nr:molybdopterin-dependent oxidoreductase [Pyrinomonadaceae bacterium]
MPESKVIPPQRPGRLKTLGGGALAGTVAALLMTLVLLILRSAFGVPTPSELVGDRFAPTLSVDTFIKLLTIFEGFNNLKKIGFGSVIGGQIVVGFLVGLAYAQIISRPGYAASPLARRLKTNNAGLRFVIIVVGILWVLSLILLWPVLGTHYYGLPLGSATVVTTTSLLAAYVLYGLCLITGYGMISHATTSRDKATQPRVQHRGRRALLLGSIGAVVGIVANKIWTQLYERATFSYDGTQYLGQDVQFITPNERFYIVTKNIIDPRVNPELWRLEIAGLVERPGGYRYQELTALPAINQETTLMCISNQVGGGLMSNAVWKGVPLGTLIQNAGLKNGVTKVVLRAVDGYDDTIPLAKALEPTTLVAYEMNGAMLPSTHGYPVRLIVPGLFGEKSVKWITRVELVAEDIKGFYEKQGWGPDFTIPTHSRFDGPDFSQPIKLGSTVPIKGVAFAGNRGISRVEVSFNDGTNWQEVKLNSPSTRLTWALWNYDWQPAQAGEYKLAVRAADGDGILQTREERWTAPHGATGYHKVTARIVS